MSGTTVEQVTCPFTTQPALQDLYRLLMLGKNGSALLVASERPPFTLPCVEIPKWERVAENLTEAVGKRYGISAICLFTPEPPGAPTDAEQPLYQVMETREARTAVPDEMRWLRLESISDQFFADEQDLFAITETLRQIAGFQSGEAIGPFARPGWIEELSLWAQRAIAPHGLRLSGKLRQLNACPTFALLRLETNGPAIWFKAVGEPNLREFQISLILSKLFPGLVPEILATHSAWHGWLTAEFASTTLDEASDARAWERSAQALAELQIASIERIHELLEAGCKNLTVASLRTAVDPFFEVMSELMEQQPKTPPPILDRDSLQRLAVHTHQVLSDWSALNIPDTLGHLDFNPGNIICSPDRCVFLDWAEACVGPPFLTLEYLRIHLAKLESADQGANSVVTDSYARAWRSVLPAPVVSKAQLIAPGLAVFAYAVAEQPWRDPKARTQHGSAPYLRSLTRRMHAEMQRLRNQGSLVPATSCGSR
jgi:hypothetical protein